MSTITPLPDPPNRSDPINFAARADAFLAALQVMVDQFNAAAFGSGAELGADLVSSLESRGDALITAMSTLAGAIPRTQHQKNADVLSIADIATPQQAVDGALSIGGRVYLPAGTYTGNVSNPWGVSIEGPGRLFDAGGVQRSTYAEPLSRCVFGEEYLWSFHNKLLVLVRGVPLKVLYSGDSTTFGAFDVGSLPEAQRIHSLMDSWSRKLGVHGLVHINRGNNGKQAREWVQTGDALDQDIAAYPDMSVYVLRLGLNDGSPGYHDLAQTQSAIRTGLARLRAFKTVSDLAIILMSPNSTSETGARDEAWHESMTQFLRRAAREYLCTFIDTYALLRDARSGAGMWFDTQGAGGSSIHPDGAFNHLIAAKLADVMFAPVSIQTVATTQFWNSSSTSERPVTSSTLAASGFFPYGTTIYRTDSPLTFPIDGCVITTKSADGITRQANIGFASELAKVEYTRYALEGGAWSLWRGYDTSVAPVNSWTNFDGSTPSPNYRKSIDGTVFIDARLKNASATPSVMFSVPVGFRPQSDKTYPICNAAGTTGAVSVSTGGDISFVAGPNGDVNIHISYQAYN